MWGEEEDAMFEQQAYTLDFSNQVSQTPPKQNVFRRESSVEEPVSYPEPEWRSEAERQKCLKEKEEKSAKFEEIARKKGIQIVDPKTLENGDNKNEESPNQLVNEIGDGDHINKIYHNEVKGTEASEKSYLNSQELPVEKEVGDKTEDKSEAGVDAADTNETSSLPLSSITTSLSIPDRSASPVHDLARRIVLEVTAYKDFLLGIFVREY